MIKIVFAIIFQKKKPNTSSNYVHKTETKKEIK
jgi:hypothetical protein